jgi:hypothetical protein
MFADHSRGCMWQRVSTIELWYRGLAQAALLLVDGIHLGHELQLTLPNEGDAVGCLKRQRTGCMGQQCTCLGGRVLAGTEDTPQLDCRCQVQLTTTGNTCCIR